MSNCHDYATQCLKHFGGTLWLKGPWFTNTNFILTSDSMNVHHILSKNHGNYRRGSDFNEIFEIVVGGIFNSDSIEWKQQRTLLHSLLTNKSFENFLQQTIQIQKKLENSLLPFLDHHASKVGACLDLQDIIEIERFTFDTTCTSLFGFDPKSLPESYIELSEIAYVKALPEIEKTILYRHIIPTWFWKLLNWLEIGQEKKYNLAKQNLEQFLHDGIKKSIREVKRRWNDTGEVEESEFHLIKMLMREGVGNGEIVDHKFLRDTAFTIFLAGNSTISIGLSWFFWLVSTHPTVEAKIIQEIKDNCLTKEGNLLTSSVEMLNKMVYLHGAICEALRLYPPVPFEHKCAIKSDILPSGDRVSPNTKILYMLYSMGSLRDGYQKKDVCDGGFDDFVVDLNIV